MRSNQEHEVNENAAFSPDIPEDLVQHGFTAPSFNDNENTPEQIPEEGYVKEDGIRHFPDGSAAIEGPEQEIPKPIDVDEHDQNIAEFLDEQTLSEIGNQLKNAIEDDRQSQEQYFQNLANLIGLLGIKAIDSALENENGVPNVNSSALFETWLHYIATIMGAIFPSKGPVDTVILGEQNDHLQNIAYRMTQFYTYFLQQVDKGFEKELKRTVAWSVFDSIYSKVFIDPVLGRPTHRMIKPEDFIINRDLSSHLSAARKTQIHRMDKREFDLRKMLKEYRETDIMPTYLDSSGDNVIQQELDEISGFERLGGKSSTAPDQFEIYESHVDYRISKDPAARDFDIPLPYIITLDASSAKILRIQRNWKKGDFLKKNREYFVNWSLMPSLDGEGYGLSQYAAQSAQAATTILRQLIEAGMYSNFPGGVYQAGLRLENNTLRPAPGEFMPIQTGGIPISQAIEALPYKEPSQALNDLKNQLEDTIRKPSAIINDAITEMAPRAPAASVLAMLENLHKVPNFVIQGYHKSFECMLGLFKERFAEWLPEGQPYPFLVPGGKHVIMRSDFEADIQVIPSSDPSLQNSMFRFMRAEIILNNARQDPDIHDMRHANQFFYKNLGLSAEEIHKILLPKEEEEEPPSPLDPITENQNLLTSIGVAAGIDQDHDAHIMVHSTLYKNPIASQDEEIMSAIKAHIMDHEAKKLLIQFQAQSGQQMPEDPSQISMEMQNQIAVVAAQMAQQQEQQQQQETPPDPALITAQASLTEAQIYGEEVRVSEHKANLEAENQKLKLMLDKERLNFEQYKYDKDYALKEIETGVKVESADTQRITADAKQQLDETKVAADILTKSQQLTNHVIESHAKHIDKTHNID